MGIAAGKKRFQITLTEDRWEHFKSLVRETGAARGTETLILDEMVAMMIPSLEHFLRIRKEQGREPSYADLMMAVGGFLHELGEREQLKL